MNRFDPDLTETGEYPAVTPEGPLRVRVEVAARSEVGLVRRNNEDYFLTGRLCHVQEILSTNIEAHRLPMLRQEVGHAFVVADGMGGMASGEEASRLAIISGLELIRDAARWPLEVASTEDALGVIETMRDYVRTVNRRVYERASAHASMEGMGTTLTVAYSVGLRLIVLHVGDSRAYLFHDGLLQQITRDHTVAQELLAAGKISRADLKTHRLRNVLTNYIGSPDAGIEAEAHLLHLADGDRLLVCSDGLTDQVDDDRIAEVLGGGGDAVSSCDALIASALDAGGRDNVTAIVACYHVES